MANEPQKTRIYELGDVTSGYMMLDQGAGLPTGKLHTSAYTDEILSKVANTYATQSQLTTGLSGKVDKENGKGLSTNDYTNQDKAVLGSVSGRVEDIEDLIPSNASTFNQLATIDDIGAAATGAFKVVSLANDEPDVSDPSTKIIYLTKDSSLQVTDPYTEWIWESGANSAWHIIGETTPDFSDYYTKSEADNKFATSAWVETELDGKVDKVTGMGLSHEDFTSAYKDKIDTIEASAQKNVQSDWEETNSASDSFIKNKPTIPEAQVQSDWEESDSAEPSYIKNKPQNLSIVGGEGITVTESQGNLEISVSADYATEDYVDQALESKLDKSYSAEFYPMNENPAGYLTEHQSLSAYATSAWVEEQGYLTSDDLTDYATREYVQEETSGKVDKVDGKGLSTNDFTNELLDKLDDIEASAQKNVQSDWEEVDSASDSYIQNKPTPISLRGGEGISVTESQGDLLIAVSADYATEDYVDTLVSAKMDKSMSAEFYPYHSNPSGYLINSDLGGYATQTWVEEQGYATESYVQTQTSGKVDKVTGMGLSHVDFTSAYQSKLDSISPSAEVNVQSDWSVTNSALDSYIANKPDIIIPQVGAGVSDVPKYIMVVTAMPPAAQIGPDTIYLVQGTYIGT